MRKCVAIDLHAALCLAAVLATPTAAHAGGFAVAEQSAVAGGSGGASTARSDDAGAAWYNPAALADAGGFRAGIGMLAAMPSLQAEAMDGTWRASTESSTSTPPHLYLSHAAGDLAFGLSMGVPFGGGVTWPSDWAGRSEIISSKLEVFRIAPFVAWRVGKLRIAGGLHLDAARLRINRSLDFVDTEGDVFLDMDGRGVGLDAAAFYEASDELHVGLTYKGRTRIALAGGANFDAPDAFDQKTVDQNARTEMTMPDRIVAGVKWRRGRLAVLADVDLTLWSVNDELVVDFENDATPDAVQKNAWSSTVALRLGAEYEVRPATQVRGGVFFDPSPASAKTLAPSSPDSTRIGATVGVSRAVSSDVTVDAFYEYMKLLSRTSDNMDALEARYGGYAHILGVGLRLRR